MNHTLTTLLGGLILFAFNANAAEKYKINLQRSNLQINKLSKSGESFSKITLKGFETDKTIGAPELPVKSWLIKGIPQNIKVNLKINSTFTLDNTKPYPTQEQDCRCETNKPKSFVFNSSLYKKSHENISISYLGAYRGTPISRVDLHVGSYDIKTNTVELISSADVEINSESFSLPRQDLKDYLIIAPANLVDGVSDFVNWKRSNGYNVYVETIAAPNNTLTGIKSLVRQYYTEKGIDFAIIVGDENAVPMFKVDTSGSYRTPSDLQYYTMDGANDFIPDVLASRIVASNPAEVALQLNKAIQFEQRSFQNSSGMKKFIGIASNEGSNPSDDEYVRSIEDKFKQTLAVDVLHLHQNDSTNSKPAILNSAFDGGAFWLTYLGHGSGSSWPSMNQSYSTSDINQIRNFPSVKPIIIDVACQNGRLVSGYLGTTFMKTDSSTVSNALGSAAYYGGSVNISWHPPAVMARGIAYEHMAKRFHHLGEALLAGQLYLAANWNNKEQVIDNFEWYHLQGDPGMNVEFK